MDKEFLEIFELLAENPKLAKCNNIGVIASNLMIAKELRGRNEIEAEKLKNMSEQIDAVKNQLDSVFKGLFPQPEISKDNIVN